MSFNIRNLKKLKKSFSLDKNQDQSQKLQLNSSHHNPNSENQANENNHQKLKRLASYEKVIRNEIAKLKNHNRSNNNLDIKAVEDIDDFHFLSDTGAVSNEKKMRNQKIGQDETPKSPTRSKNDADRQTLKSLSIGENLLARLRDKTNTSNNNNTSSNTNASDHGHNHKDRRISAISKISKDSFMTANSHMTANSAISFRNPDISLNNDLLRLQEELRTLNRFSKKSLARSKTLEMEKAYSIIALNRSTCASNPSIDAIHGNQNCLLENPNPNSNANVNGNYNHNDQVGLHRDKTISRESANTLHSNSNSISVIRNVNHTSDGVNLQHAQINQHNNSINKPKSKKIKDCHHQTQNSCGPTPKRLFSENSFKFPPLGIPEISVPATLEHIGMSRRDKKNNNNYNNNHPNGRNYASHTTNRCGGRNDQNDSINGYYNNDDRDFVDNFFDCSPLQNSCGVGLNRKSSFTKKMDFLRVKESCAANNDRNQQNYESAQETLNTRNNKSVIRRSESLYESAQPTNRLSQKSKLNRSSSNKISRKELSSSSRRMRTGTVEALNPSHQNSGDEAIIAKDIAKIRTKKLLQRNVSLPNPEKPNSLKTPVYAIPDLTMNKPTPQDLAALRERHLNHERSASPDEELNNNNQGSATNLFGCNVGVSASCAGNANSYYGQICTDGKNENNDESLCNNGPGRRGFPVPSMSSLRTPRGRIKIVGSSKTMPINLSMQLSKERQDSRDQHELASTGPPDSVRGTAGGCTNLVTGPKGNNARDRRISGVSYNSLGMLSDTSNHIHATGNPNRLNFVANKGHPPIKNSLSHNTIQENNIYARANETKFQRKPSNKFEDAKAKIRFNRIKSLTDNNPEKHSNSFKITYHNTTNGNGTEDQEQQSQTRKSKQRAQRTQSDQNHNKNKNKNLNLTLKEQSERYSTKQFGEIQQNNNSDPNSGSSYKIINVSTRKTTRITPADLSRRNINTAPTVHSPTAQNMMHTISQDKAEKIFDEILNHRSSVKSQQSQQSQKQKVYKTRSLGRDGNMRNNNSNKIGATRSDNMSRIEEESGVSGGGGGGGHIKIQRSRVYSEKRNGQQGAIHVRVARDRSKSTKR